MNEKESVCICTNPIDCPIHNISRLSGLDYSEIRQQQPSYEGCRAQEGLIPKRKKQGEPDLTQLQILRRKAMGLNPVALEKLFKKRLSESKRKGQQMRHEREKREKKEKMSN